MIKAHEHGSRVHPTQKPVALMQWILDVLKVPVGATVLDPFMGSGATGIACMNTGRNFIGIEIVEEYFIVAKKRIEQAQLQLNMFDGITSTA
jgi:DNA modification methylase